VFLPLVKILSRHQTHRSVQTGIDGCCSGKCLYGALCREFRQPSATPHLVNALTRRCANQIRISVAFHLSVSAGWSRKSRYEEAIVFLTFAQVRVFGGCARVPD
jgi:hypothetical protein